MSRQPTDRPVVCSACGMDLSEHELGTACPGCGATARTYKIEPKPEAAESDTEAGPA
jgi:uncharacterized Zn finger protein (UPF0148 family)